MRDGETTGRREFLILAAAAVAGAMAPPALAQSRAGAQKLKFFTAAEFRALDEIAEMIIPADARSGGARAAGVARFIDARIAESLDPAWRQSWKDDLAEVDRLARLLFGKPFADGTPAQKTRLLERISRNEARPSEPGEYAFGTIKWTVAETYYRTKIGIHDEIGYAGNVLLDEFVGTDISGQPAMKSPG